MIAPARLAAYDVLRALSQQRSDLPTAVAQSRERLTDDRDRALAADIAAGVQRWRGRLDHLLVHFAKRPLTKLDGEIVDILRLSAYQLLFLDRVPAAAIVNDAVQLAGKVGKRSAAGLVNAVLRSLSRQRLKLPLPTVPADPSDREAALDYLSVTLSHPRWLAARWYDRLGFDRAAAWMTFNNHPALLTLRANRLRTSADDLAAALASRGIEARRGQFAPDALVIEGGHPLSDPTLDPGDYVVQDEASQLVALTAGDRPGPRILDACASPGGKTTAFAAAVAAGGTVVACDIRDKRIQLLRRTVATAGVANVLIAQADLAAGLPFASDFSCVVVDAPCSGLGVLRRDPDIRWRRLEADLEPLAAAQLAMLREAARVVAPGGRLVYATCSTEPEENEQIVEEFLEGNRAFRAASPQQVHPQLPAAVLDPEGHLRTSPDAHGLEGFFAAVLERVG